MVSKQAMEDRLEKVRKLRELKKFGKKVQQEVTIKRAKEKREMLDQVILQPRRYTKLFRFLNCAAKLKYFISGNIDYDCCYKRLKSSAKVREAILTS